MATQPPPWAYGVDLDTARARLHALGIPAHQRPGYVFPPPHTADLYQRGDAGPTLTRESKRASVLVALLETAQDGLCVLLSRRSATLRSHGGQVCFPGGKNEPGETDQQSAFREAQEEVGMMPMAPQVICELERLAQPSFKPPLIVTPVVVAMREATFATLAPSPDECDAVFYAPLWRFIVGGEGHRNEAYPMGGNVYLVNHFAVVFRGELFDVWGQTADILTRLALVVYGRARPEFADRTWKDEGSSGGGGGGGSCSGCDSGDRGGRVCGGEGCSGGEGRRDSAGARTLTTCTCSASRRTVNAVAFRQLQEVAAAFAIARGRKAGGAGGIRLPARL